MPSNARILLIEPELEIQNLLVKRLTKLGFIVVLASDGNIALDYFHQQPFDLVILETMLPGIDGYSLCRKIRERSELPIIILSGASDISDRVLGLDIGANGYLTKPFSPNELEARIRAQLRHIISRPKNSKIKNFENIRFGDLHIDLKTKFVARGISPIKLTDIEYNLLEILIDQAGNPMSRKIILANVWGFTPERAIDTRIVDVHISRLRSKLEKNPKDPDLIITIRGVGYMFQPY